MFAMSHRRNFLLFSDEHLPRGSDQWQIWSIQFSKITEISDKTSKKSILKKSKVWGLTGGPTESGGGWRFFQIFFKPWSDDGKNLNKFLRPNFSQTLLLPEKQHFLPLFTPFPPFIPRVVYSRVDRKWFRALPTLGRNIFPLRVWEGRNTQEGCDTCRLCICTEGFWYCCAYRYWFGDLTKTTECLRGRIDVQRCRRKTYSTWYCLNRMTEMKCSWGCCLVFFRRVIQSVMRKLWVVECHVEGLFSTTKSLLQYCSHVYKKPPMKTWRIASLLTTHPPCN